MTNYLTAIQAWFIKRNRRQQWYLFFGSFILIYFIYTAIFFRPLLFKKKLLAEQMVALQLEKITLEQQIEQLKISMKDPLFINMQATQKSMSQNLIKKQRYAEQLKSNLFSFQPLTKLTSAILDKTNSYVSLVSLEQLPEEDWPIKAEVTDNPLLKNMAAYQHAIRLNFKSDYFSTMRYLKSLEKLSEHVYWDSLDYKVLQYPTASVVLKFHVLSLQKS